MNEREIYTVGHSNHAPEVFLDLLRQHSIDTLIDTRSQPYSKFVPHFNPDEMKFAVMQAGIRCVFLGRELGGRPESRDCYDSEGHVLYGKVAVSEGFLRGIAKLEKALPTRRMALCCAEENPSECHRRLLVGRVLTERGLNVLHIRANSRFLSGIICLEHQHFDGDTDCHSTKDSELSYTSLAKRQATLIALR